MQISLSKLPSEICELIRHARDIADARAVHAYLVGGFVRDLILGVRNYDLDIVIEGDGIAFAEQLGRSLGVRIVRHHRFGTATIAAHHRKIDITTARQESYPAPAALPVVAAGSMRHDLFRRDFTINAIALHINGKQYGKVVDYYNGVCDLRSKIVRILHLESFIDDPTRIIRAVRFEQRFGFTIEQQTLRALKKAIKKGMLGKVEPQRMRDELILVLKEENPILPLRRLHALGAFGFLHEQVRVTPAVVALLESLEKELYWFREHCSHHRHIDAWLLYLMGLLDSLHADHLRRLCAKLALRKGDSKRLLMTKTAAEACVRSLSAQALKPSQVYALLEPLSFEVMLFIRARSKNTVAHTRIEEYLKIYSGIYPHVRGEDLRSLGVPPGPVYQKILKKILNARLDGLVLSRDEELALAKRLIGRQRA